MLQYADGKRVSCKFKLKTRGDLEMSLTCSQLPRDHVALEAIAGGPEPIRFEGETTNHLRLRVEHGMTLIDWRIGMNSDEGAFITYRCPRTALSPAALKRASALTVSFALVNLVFPALEAVAYEARKGSGWRRCRTTLTIAGRTMTLVQPHDFEARVARLRATGGNVITTILDTSDVTPEELPAVVEVVNRLASLLTLATSNAVSWSRYTASDATTGRRIFAEMRRPPRKSYGGLPLAPNQNPADFKSFIERTYPTYCLRLADYQLDRVAHARVDAISGGSLETRALLACVLVEFLANACASENGYAAPVPSKRFGAIQGELRSRVSATLHELLPEILGD